MDDVVQLEARAIGLMKSGDFGDEAVRINQALVERAPQNDRAWTRLGRCLLEQRRFELLFDSVNATSIAARIVEARQRQGAAGTKLFHANSCHPGGAGHIDAFHHGGRWEPQFNISWFTEPSMASRMRIGIGFNT